MKKLRLRTRRYARRFYHRFGYYTGFEFVRDKGIARGYNTTLGKFVIPNLPVVVSPDEAKEFFARKEPFAFVVLRTPESLRATADETSFEACARVILGWCEGESLKDDDPELSRVLDLTDPATKEKYGYDYPLSHFYGAKRK